MIKVKVTAWHNASASNIVTTYMSRTDRLAEFKLCENYPTCVAQRLTHVQGQKVKYWNHNNSAADSLMSLKFGTRHRAYYKRANWGQRSRSQRSRSQRNVTYWQSNRYKTGTDTARLTDFKLQCIAVATFPSIAVCWMYPQQFYC